MRLYSGVVGVHFTNAPRRQDELSRERHGSVFIVLGRISRLSQGDGVIKSIVYRPFDEFDMATT